jgi:hypothetical protein
MESYESIKIIGCPGNADGESTIYNVSGQILKCNEMSQVHMALKSNFVTIWRLGTYLNWYLHVP